MVSPVGLTAATTAAALRAGITRVRETRLKDSQFEPRIAGVLEEEHLPPLREGLVEAMKRMTSRHRRLVRLGACALQEVAGACGGPLPLVLALPEPQPWGDPMGDAFLEHLQSQAGVEVEASSHLLRQGRAGGLMAVARGLELLATRRARQVLVGGVDTYWDARLLAHLDAEDRLKRRDVADGFIPGEGAAFLWLGVPGTAKRLGREPLASITGAGLGREPGHRYSTEPYLGEGLSQAFQQLFAGLPPQSPKVRCVYAGFNGESFWTKEWGVAYLRHAQRFETEFRMEHPAEYTGDAGAALGPMMLGAAAVGLRKGYREGPCLVWGSSDREARAAVMVQSATP
ncbi:hypothetical protein D7V97_30935 [Corallococcus sp. CA053C]|nr:hypothetical protein D7V97_30935 [Corallococcus sp. CA053C]